MTSGNEPAPNLAEVAREILRLEAEADQTHYEQDDVAADAYASSHAAALATGFLEAVRVLKEVKAHVDELEEAWRRGVIDECDGHGGTRANRNVEVARLVERTLGGGRA